MIGNSFFLFKNKVRIGISTFFLVCLMSCSQAHTIGGTVSGLNGTLVLQNNGTDDLTLTNDGSFVFFTTLPNGVSYNVTVLTQPTGQSCTVTNGSGTMSGADITNVSVTCAVPVPGTNISFTDTSNNAALFTWGAATESDLSSENESSPRTSGTSILEYKVVQSTSANDIDTVEEANAITGSGIVQDWTPNITSAEAENLTASTTYYFAVLVRNAAGSMALYPPESTTTLQGERIFITAVAPSGGGNFGGVAGGDTLCTTDANRPALGTYKAMIVGTGRVACTTANCGTGGASEHTDWVLAPNMNYVRTDNTLIATSTSAGIFSFPLTAGFAPSGTNPELWTGLTSTWLTSGGANCTNWTTTGGTGIVGIADLTTSGAINIYSQNCNRNDSQRLACVEQ